MLIVEINKDDKPKVKKFFSRRGTIKMCAKKIKHDRTTIARIVEKGTGEQEIVNKIVKYVQENTGIRA